MYLEQAVKCKRPTPWYVQKYIVVTYCWAWEFDLSNWSIVDEKFYVPTD